MNYPKKVTIGDITVRDGFQHEEIFIPTAAKLWLSEQLILAGFKHIEVTNFASDEMERLRQIFDEDLQLLGSRLGIELSCNSFEAATQASSGDWAGAVPTAKGDQ